MAVITIYGKPASDTCRELESQIRTRGSTVRYCAVADLPISESTEPVAEPLKESIIENGAEQTVLCRGSVMMRTSRAEQATSLLY